MAPKVTTQSFTVVLKKLTEAEIKQHTGVKITPEQQKSRSDIKLKTPHIQLNRLLLQEGQCVKLVAPNPMQEPAAQTPQVKAATGSIEKRPIHSKPSVALGIQAKQHTFKVRTFGLPKQRNKYYFKCRVSGCNKVFVTFRFVREWDAHHCIYHCVTK